MIPTGQDRADQTGQPGARTHFEEGPASRRVEVIDRRDKFDRPGQLPGQQVAGLDRLIRVGLAGAVGDDGECPCLESDLVQGGPEGLASGSDQGAVKAGRHRQAGGPDLPVVQGTGGSFDQRCRTGEDRLPRGVLVGQGQVQFLIQQDGRDLVRRGEHSEHGSRVAAGLRAGWSSAFRRSFLRRTA